VRPGSLLPRFRKSAVVARYGGITRCVSGYACKIDGVAGYVSTFAGENI